MIFSNELRIPIEPNTVWGALFFDMGALFYDKEHFHIDSATPPEFIDLVDKNLLNTDNLTNLGYYRYSWGFGIRFQIPMMPIRFYWGQRLVWDSNTNMLVVHPVLDQFTFVFGIGDYRF